jgi:tripartite-type tricarboxylate transporter receptor subunit TctC
MRIKTFIGAALLVGTQATAQSFPEREIELLVNYGSGGSVDRMARSVQPFLPDALGAGVIVENIGGAGGKVGLGQFMERDADGYTILTAFAPATTYVKHTTPGMFEMDDLAVINVQWIDPAVLMASTETGWTNLGEMIEAIRAAPGEYTFGSSGAGSVGPVLTEALFASLDLDVKIVPYSGGGEARRAFLSGEVDLTAAGVQGADSVKDAAVPLALFWEETDPAWPEAPTIASALEGYDVKPPIGGAYRFFAVKSELREEHPERFDALVEAFRQTVQDNAEFRAAADEAGVGSLWTGPEVGQAMIERADTYFANLLASGVQ